METIQFDCGMKEFRLGSGVLRFNPSDPNLYARFLEAAEKMEAIQQDIAAQTQALEGQDTGTAAVELVTQADTRMKQVLGWVFGCDFDALLDGVNLLAVNAGGTRLVTSLLEALTPILTEGAVRFADGQAQAAATKAKQRRGEV